MAGQRDLISRRGQIVLVVAVLVIVGAETQLLSDAMDLLAAHARLVGTSSITVFHCDAQGLLGSFNGAKELSKRGLATQFYLLDGSHSEELSLEKLRPLLLPGFRPLAIAVEADCQESGPLLSKASILGFGGEQHHWLIIGKHRGETEESELISISNSTNNLTDFEEINESAAEILGSDVSWLQDLPLLCDSDLRVARPLAVGSKHWEVRGVYRVAVGRPLTVEAAVTWSPGLPLVSSPSRINLQRHVMRTGIVLTDAEPWVNHDDTRFRHLNPWTKLNFAIVKPMSQKMNFIIKPIFASTWGYLVNGSFTGLVLMLQKKEVDLGGGGLVIKTSRMAAVDFTAETVPFYPKFLFRQPRLSAVSNIYALPFSHTVWAVYLGSVLGLTAVLVATQRLLAVYFAAEDPLPTWSDTVLFACGIICDEGYPQNPSGLSSRIVLLALLLLSVFHVTSYSACIVSLLQAPSSGYDTLEELVDSPIFMAMHDIIYNEQYVKETTDPVVQKFWRERILSRPRSEVFLPMEEGVARMRKGLFAFHADQVAYKVMAETFLEHEKCGLKDIAMFPWQVVSVPVPKGSPYKEQMRIALRWLREVGLIKREIPRWTAQKPTCQNMESTFVSVGFTEFRPAAAILMIGCAASGAFLLLEILASKFLPHLQRFRGAFSWRIPKAAEVHGSTLQTRHSPRVREPIKGKHVQFLN